MKTPLESCCQFVHTTRNWKTVNALHQMCHGLPTDAHCASNQSAFSPRSRSRCSLSPAPSKADPNTLVMLIESSPTNLDPRIGVDAQSERIDNLIFDDLLSRGDNLDVAPGLAEHWEIPDPLTYIFHLASRREVS